MDKINPLIDNNKEVTNMVLIDMNFNISDWAVLALLALFILLGLLFGATELGAKIVLYVISVFLSIFVSGIALPYLQVMPWYQTVITTLGGNATLVNWIATIIVAGLAFGIILLILSLISKAVIGLLKKGKILTRIVGMALGAADWVIVLLVVSFLFAALPGWLGSNTPDFINVANNYISQSTIIGKLMELYRQVLPILGITA